MLRHVVSTFRIRYLLQQLTRMVILSHANLQQRCHERVCSHHTAAGSHRQWTIKFLWLLSLLRTWTSCRVFSMALSQDHRGSSSKTTGSFPSSNHCSKASSALRVHQHQLRECLAMEGYSLGHIEQKCPISFCVTLCLLSVTHSRSNSCRWSWLVTQKQFKRSWLVTDYCYSWQLFLTRRKF